ncbi:MAG: hypothetical protein JWR24_4736, partial [Actinoallomurus sp.]|nr:hypothetical protein [Actinoallomurus sp.]
MAYRAPSSTWRGSAPAPPSGRSVSQAGRLIANGTLNETELLRLVRPAVSYVRALPPDHVLTDDQLRA